MRLGIAIALLACASCFTATAAHASDWLSGTYRPLQAASEGEHAAAPDMRITAQGDGWLAWFQGTSRPLQPIGGDDLAVIFPGVDAGAELQCAQSEQLILCHAKPGTRFESEGFTASTGYFSAISGSGIFELEKLP